MIVARANDGPKGKQVIERLFWAIMINAAIIPMIDPNKIANQTPNNPV